MTETERARGVRLIGRGELRAPAVVLDVDLAAAPGAYEVVVLGDACTAWCLVRHEGTPAALRFLDVGGVTEIPASRLHELLGAGLTIVQTPDGTPWRGSLTVVICTRDRVDGLLATLRSLARQSDPDFDVLVVDNSPTASAREAAETFPGLTIRYCHEIAPGLSRARNRALRTVRSEVVAWLDDDEEADPGWVHAVRLGFGAESRPDAVSGLMLPAELATQAQVEFERYGGFNKGRGLAPEVLALASDPTLDPLYPLPNFGAGGNMAFRVAPARELGGFDPRLGAGTLTHGGEETQILARLLDSGRTILHWPAAVTWHYHRRSDEALHKQFYGYSAGLSAFYMSMIRIAPLRYLPRILLVVPKGVLSMLSNKATGDEGRPPVDFPVTLLRAGRRGLLQGAWMYVRESWRQARYRRTNP